VAAGATIAFLLLVTIHLHVEGNDRAIDGLGIALLVAAGGALALCRRAPLVALTIVTIALCTYHLRSYPGGPIFVTAWISLFFVSWRGPRRTAVEGAAVLCAALALSGIVDGRAPVPLEVLFVGWSAAALFLGEAVRNRRSYLTELEARAQHLERTREEEARRRVAEDRLRIARDLHDSVAHAMATINVHAGAAAHVVDRRPSAAKDALAAIQRASGDVLDELAAMLYVLRDETRRDTDDRRPTPGIGQIEELVATMQATELPVRLEMVGTFDEVPEPIGTAAYRIVQESLTNVLRHADAAATTVTVRSVGGRFEVTIADEGGLVRGSTPTGTGVGIRGMRERAEATGGALTAGTQGDGRGGFVVHASWPVTS
jgi:signal transduction histidine kinase